MRRLRWIVLIAAVSGCYFETPTHSTQPEDNTDPIEGTDSGPAPTNEAGEPIETPDGEVVTPAPEDAGMDASTRLDSGTPTSPAEAGTSEAGTIADAATDAGPKCACDAGTVCIAATGQCVECVADTDCKSGAKAKCDQTTHSCVACDAKDQCARFAGLNVCAAGNCVQCSAGDQAACTSASDVCKTGGNQCVDCNVNTDCKTATASRCAANACAACMVDADCSQIAGKNVCLAGACVQCTKDKAAACASGGTQYVCDPSSHACDMNRRARSKTLCNACASSTDTACKARPDCISDNECQSGQACVTVPAGGAKRVCQAIKTTAACPRPYVGVTAAPAASADGASVTVCTFRTAATCQSFADFSNKRCGVPNASMPGGQGPDDTKCGESGVSDGLCIYAPGFSEYRCTVPCSNDAADCPVGGTIICDTSSAANFCSFM